MATAKKSTTKKETTPTVIKGYKGFDKNLKCRDKQYALNAEFTEDDAIVCEKGIHFCQNPLDVFLYYNPSESRFAEVEGSGKTVDHPNEDSKIACTHLKIGGELSLHSLINAAVSFVFERTVKTKEKTNTEPNKLCSNTVKRGAASNSGDRGAASNSGYSGTASNSGDSGAASNSGDRGTASNSGDRGAASNSGYRGAASNSGDRGAASNSGYSGAASNSGYRGAASNSGDRGTASNSGDSGAAFTIGSYSKAITDAKESVAVGVGYSNKAKASLGSWIVLAERNNKLEILDIKTVKVDGTNIKADTFYSLVSGCFIED